MGEPGLVDHLQVTLKVAEIFRSLQGEGYRQGEPTAFIRLAGCNERCSWCDTTYAQEGGERLSLPAILAAIAKPKEEPVCVTGGEPLLQAGIQALFDALKAAGRLVTVETNGTVDISRFTNVDSFAVDYKLPSARSRNPFMEVNFSALRPVDELKFVIAGKADYQAAKAVIENRPIRSKVVFSPVWGTGVEVDLAEWIIADRLRVRYSIQLHKIIGGLR